MDFHNCDKHVQAPVSRYEIPLNTTTSDGQMKRKSLAVYIVYAYAGGWWVGAGRGRGGAGACSLGQISNRHISETVTDNPINMVHFSD